VYSALRPSWLARSHVSQIGEFQKRCKLSPTALSTLSRRGRDPGCRYISSGGLNGLVAWPCKKRMSHQFSHPVSSARPPSRVLTLTSMRIFLRISLPTICLFLRVWISFAQGNSDPANAQQSPRGPQKPSAAGTLVVSQKRVERGVEGYIAFFLVSSSGSQVEEKRLGLTGDSVSFSLPAGTNYELLSYVRDCDGNCSGLGPRTAECRAPFTLKAGETLYAKRLPEQRPTCKLIFSSSPFN